jgi:histidine phosphotransferase ChpT
MPDKQDLSALVGSRICHDLISPLGAIGNGVELLGMSPAAAGPELALIAESVAAANARIRFYRVAFGAAAEGQRIARPEILSILSDLTRGARLNIEWLVATDQPRSDVKLAFLLIQCLETALPFGGRIAVTIEGGHWQLLGLAARMKVDAALWAALADPGATRNLSAAHVQFALAPAAAEARGRSLRSVIGEEEIRLSF